MTAGVISLAVAFALSAAGFDLLGAQGAVSSADAARYAARRERAYARLGENLLVVQSRWSPAPANQPGFDQDAAFHYYTGASRLIGAVLVLDGATRRAEIFLPSARPGTYVGMSQAGLGADRAASLRVDAVSEWRAFAPFIERRLADSPRLTIHVDDGGSEAASAGQLASPLDSLAAPGNPHVAWRRSLHRRWPTATIVRDTAITAGLRAVKDSSEIAVLRRVAANSVAAFVAGLPRFGAGRRQRHVEAAVVEACTRLGDGPSFWPWVMTGPNAVFPAPFSSALDQHNLDRAMRAGEVARYDLGCKVDHYMGDVGRTLPVTGTFTPEQREVIDLMAATYRAGLAVLRDGVEAEALLRAGVAEASRLRESTRTTLGKRAATLLMQPDSLPYWQTHGVGLEHAEPLPPVLRAGMVLAYEPMFTAGGQGFYMEDMILITPTGYEILTKGLPTTAVEIERAMRRRQP